jgi:catechol 2,3-dioxygenase-like lactoylglutathione lyase family enzyme
MSGTQRAGGAADDAATGAVGPPVCRIARFGRVVADLERAERFLAAAFGFTTTGRIAGDSGFAELVGVPGAMTRRTHMRLGDQEIALTAFDPPGRPYPPGSTSSDLWFQHLAIVVADIDAAHAQVREARQVMPITEGDPIRLPCAAGGVRAYKFRDGDGHPLELLEFHPESTPTAWRRQDRSGVFLGIDHTAIAVTDTRRSIGFFRSSFGLMAAMQTENVGAEQSRLDAIGGARVTVSSLNPVEEIPHLELLSYETGRRRPSKTAASNDIAATYVVLQTPDLGQTARALAAGSARFVSPGISTLADGTRALMILDPDGHRFIAEEVKGPGAET